MKLKVINESINSINKNNLHIIWYEDEKGNKWFPNLESNQHPETGKPKEFVYQHSCFPYILRHDILREVVPEEVETCNHPREFLETEHGIFQTQRCGKCGGFRQRRAGRPWPTKWMAHGSRPVAAIESSWPEDLVLAMANSGDYSLSEAIMVCANACSRCMNALGHRYGLGWGYPELSATWQHAGTICDYCKNMSSKRYLD